jgi:hypothetical protein
MFSSLVGKLPSEVLEAAAASLFMYSREVADSPVGIKLQTITRRLNLSLDELRALCRRDFVTKNASYIPHGSPFFSELMVGDLNIIPSRSLVQTVQQILQVQQQSIEHIAFLGRELMGMRRDLNKMMNMCSRSSIKAVRIPQQSSAVEEGSGKGVEDHLLYNESNDAYEEEVRSIEVFASASQNDNAYPEMLISLKNLTCAKAFYHYYVDNLPNTEKTRKAEFAFSDISKVVNFMRRCITSVDSIPPMPNSIADKITWGKTIEQLSEEAYCTMKKVLYPESKKAEFVVLTSSAVKKLRKFSGNHASLREKEIRDPYTVDVIEADDCSKINNNDTGDNSLSHPIKNDLPTLLEFMRRRKCAETVISDARICDISADEKYAAMGIRTRMYLLKYFLTSKENHADYEFLRMYADGSNGQCFYHCMIQAAKKVLSSSLEEVYQLKAICSQEINSLLADVIPEIVQSAVDVLNPDLTHYTNHGAMLAVSNYLDMNIVIQESKTVVLEGARREFSSSISFPFPFLKDRKTVFLHHRSSIVGNADLEQGGHYELIGILSYETGEILLSLESANPYLSIGQLYDYSREHQYYSIYEESYNEGDPSIYHTQPLSQ